MAKTLDEFVKENSNYISIKSGEKYSGVYRGYKIVEKDIKGESKQFVRYMIEDATDSRVRTLDSQSAGLARKMEKVVAGDLITLSRTGEGFDTKWNVVIAGEKEVPDEEIPIIEEQ